MAIRERKFYMGPDQVTELARHLLMEAMLLSAPLLLAAAVISIGLSVLQTLTSIQEQTITTIPRLTAVAVMSIAGMPWLLRNLVGYTISLFRDFHRFLG
jgi:flagellar biosynthetic protein FliQ